MMRILRHSIFCALTVSSLVGVLHAQTFRDVSTEAGFFGENSSWGAGWADYDRDGDLDVLTVGHLQQETFSISQLWRNNGDGTFTDVTVQAGLIPNNGDVHGVAWADFNNDGYVDIFMGKEGPKNPMGHEVWRNNGDGTFTNVARAMGLSELHHGKGISSVDYDLDGDLDFLMVDGVKPFNHLYRNDAAVQFTEVATEAGVVNEGQPNRSAAWADFNGDGLPDVIVFAPYILEPPPDPNAPFCALFVNRGDGTFVDGTVAAGISVVPTCAAGSWGDYDNDGDVDLYITMSKNIPGALYRNNGNGTFTDVTEASGALNASDARGVVWGDYDNDGDLDLYVVNVANAKTPNRLYRNNGDGTFTDVTAEAGVEVQVEGGGVDASFADYNRDGFLDLFVTNGAAKKRGPYVLLQNRSKAQGNRNHWLKVRLVGRQSNRDGLMTKVWAATAQGTQFREHTGPGHYMSQDRMPLHFGMGTATVTRLELSWPSGTRQVVENLAVDQVVPVAEGESIAQGRPPTTAPGYNLWQSDTGEWHLRWYGEPGEPRHQFTGHISTDGVFTAVTPQSFEDNDVVTWDAGTITFSALARDTFDEVVFVTTGAEVRLDLQQDGAAHPRSIRIGRHGIRPGSLPLVLPNS